MGRISRLPEHRYRHCALIALQQHSPLPKKFYSIELVELKIIDVSDCTKTGISILTLATVSYEYLLMYPIIKGIFVSLFAPLFPDGTWNTWTEWTLESSNFTWFCRAAGLDLVNRFRVQSCQAAEYGGEQVCPDPGADSYEVDELAKTECEGELRGGGVVKNNWFSFKTY